MGKALAAFPTFRRFDQTVTLGTTQYRFVFTWRRRTQSWYLDVYTVAGALLIAGRRLSAKWAPLLGLNVVGLPPGLLFVRGNDGYTQADLGTALLVTYYELSELVLPSTSRGLTVTL